MSGIVGNNVGRGSGTVKAAVVGADAITGDEIADDAIDSEHYTDGSIDNAHIADDAIDSEHYAAGSIDTAHIATNQIDETLMKDAFVGDFTDATVTASDYFVHGDATDSGNTKKDTIQGILDLAGGGGLVFIAAVTASSSATVDFLSSFSSTYDSFIVKYQGVVPETEGQNLLLLVAQGGAAKTDSNYDYIAHTHIAGGAQGSTSAAAQPAARTINTGSGAATSESISADLTFYNVNDTTNFKNWTFVGQYQDAGGSGVFLRGGGSFDLNATALSGFQFKFGSGNVEAGTFRLYGVVNS